MMWTGKACERCEKLGFEKCYCGKKLPYRQQLLLDNIRTNGEIYIGFGTPAIMKSAMSLVEKGYAEIAEQHPGYGIDFKAVSNE